MFIAKNLRRVCTKFTKKLFNYRRNYSILRNSVFLIIFSMFVSIGVIYHYHCTSSGYFIENEDYIAYHDREGALPSIDGSTFSPRSDDIFFTETSCCGELTSRQACSIESAARLHPNRTVFVMFSGIVSKKKFRNDIFIKLRSFRNIRIYRMRHRDVVINTPLEPVYEVTPFYESEIFVTYLKVINLFVMLYKWGGVHLSLDMLVVKSLTPLGHNWIGKAHNLVVHPAAMALSKDPIGRRVSEAILNELKRCYVWDYYEIRTPDDLTKILTKVCTTNDVSQWSSDTCQGFNVLNPTYFYPVFHTEAELYFLPGRLAISTENVFGHYFWLAQTYNSTIERGSPYMKLAKKYCPTIYKLNTKDFGG